LEWLLAWDIMVQQVDRKKTKWMMMRKQRGAGFFRATACVLIKEHAARRAPAFRCAHADPSPEPASPEKHQES